MRKLSFLIIFVTTVTTLVSAQSYFSQQQSVRFYKSSLGSNPSSVWFGGQATYQLSSRSEFADNITPTARGFWEIAKFSVKKKEIVLPSVFNIGMLRSISTDYENNQDEIDANLREIANSSQGIFIGLNPYCTIFKKNKGFSITLHALTSAKINAFKPDTSTINYLLQGRFSLGTDITIGESYPLTLSFAPVYSVFDSKEYEKIFGDDKSDMLSFESSIIIPIGAGIGAVLDFNYGKNIDFAWGFGIIFAVQK